MSSNNLGKALLALIKNKLKLNIGTKDSISADINTEKDPVKEKKVREERKLEKKLEQKNKIKTFNQVTSDIPKVPLKKRLPEVLGVLSVCLTLLVSSSLLVVLTNTPESEEEKVYDTNVVKTQGDVFSSLNTDESNDGRTFSYYDNLLLDGKLNFLTTKNISATGKFGTDIFLARSKEEQYEFLRRNNNQTFLAWVIKQNARAIFSDYSSEEINSAVDTIAYYLFGSISRLYFQSNATTFQNYVQSLGYDNSFDFLEKKLVPRAFIYFYFLDRMGKAEVSNSLTGAFNAEEVLKANSFYQVWGLKISKNFKSFEDSSDPFCKGMDTITQTNGPTRTQWQNILRCKYINGDSVYGQRSIQTDEIDGSLYAGFLGNMSLADTSWVNFCNFISAQICSDVDYSSTNLLIKPLYNLFRETVTSDTTYVTANTFDLEIVENEADGVDTLLVPYEDYFLTIRTSKIGWNNIYDTESTSTKKLDLERKAAMGSLVDFIDENSSTTTYTNFCNGVTSTDFTNTVASTEVDVEVFIFDEFTSLLFENLCSSGVSFS